MRFIRFAVIVMVLATFSITLNTRAAQPITDENAEFRVRPAGPSGDPPTANAAAGQWKYETGSIQESDKYAFGFGLNQGVISARPGHRLIIVKASFHNASGTWWKFSSSSFSLLDNQGRRASAQFIGRREQVARPGVIDRSSGSSQTREGITFLRWNVNIDSSGSRAEWELAPGGSYEETLIFTVPAGTQVARLVLDVAKSVAVGEPEARGLPAAGEPLPEAGPSERTPKQADDDLKGRPTRRNAAGHPTQAPAPPSARSDKDPGPGNSQTTQEARARSRLLQAQALEKSGNKAGALIFYRSILADFPGTAQANAAESRISDLEGMK